MNAAYTANFSLGSSTNTVTCGSSVPTTCSVGEVVVWNMGTLPPEGSGTFEMIPNVLNVAEGTQIQFEAEVRIDGKQVVSKSETVFVGSLFDSSGYPAFRADINNDGAITLEDLILVLQNLGGYNVDLTSFGDCSCDGKLGFPEALSILQELKK